MNFAVAFSKKDTINPILDTGISQSPKWPILCRVGL